MTRGLRKVGMLERLGYRPKTTPVHVVPSPMEAAERAAKTSALIERMIAEGHERADERRRVMLENAATRKIKDMEARVAVEGNTDGNHDNVEGAE